MNHLQPQKLMEPNPCPICGGHKESGRTTFTADLGESLVVVRHVPAMICNQCGEEWIGNTTAKQLQAIVNNARKEHRQFEVLSLA